MKKLIPVVAGALALALSLSACSNDTDKPEEPGDVVVPSEGWDVNPKAYEELKDGGTLTIPMSSELVTFNIYSAVGNNAQLVFGTSPLSEPWYFVNGLGELIWNPLFLTEEPKPVITDDQMVITLKINPAAVWADGAKITADDWIATWKARNGEQKEYKLATSDGWEQIESITSTDDGATATITFKTTYPDWLAIVYLGPQRAESVKDAETFNDGWIDAEVVKNWLSGPFTIESFDKATSTVTMVRNPNWWGETAKLDKVILKYVAGAQQATAFANGEIDYYDIGSDADGYIQATTAINSVVRQSNGPNYRHFTVNSQTPALRDVNVRQAVLMGLDRVTITQSDLVGLPVDDAQISNNVFVMGQEGYVDLSEQTGLKYDVAAAKAKLETAGYVMNDATGFYEKDGAQLTLYFAVLTGIVASENEALLIQSQLKEIGIDIQFRQINTATDWPGVLTAHNFDIIAFSWIGTPFPLQNIGQIYGCSADGTPSDSNFPQLCNGEIDSLREQIDTEMDVAKRLELGKQLAEKIWTEVHTITLWQRPTLIGVRDTLANIGAGGMARTPYTWVNVGYVA
ncbi:MAG: ABC transporter family substrate-binding protein [Propionibacteriaceae bacterium]|jgi:peptide/nickel transport system substrate-binding protein|nr:ABC transporter family substrate-binding protein [Propionibacteriaceae bacterium]